MKKRLYKSFYEKKIFGVCAGIAQYFDVDPVLVRLIWLTTSCFFFPAIIAYFIAAIIMPYDNNKNTDNYEYANYD